ncbi:MAG: hypothetical protein Q7O66_20285, partial [Dehalococcoidia bacterium]|nr:hypothetical protein [Dehalococcoidia bacterium]
AVRQATGELSRFSQLPFVTDAEMIAILGTEVALAIARLDEQNVAQGTCSVCRGLCCNQMRCEIFAPEFGQCPIFTVRPILCRFNFCYRFGKANAGVAKELTAIAADVVVLVSAGSQEAASFDLNVSLYGECRLADEALSENLLPLTRVMALARKGDISWTEAENLLHAEVTAYRQKRKLLPVTRERAAALAFFRRTPL